MAYNKHDKSTLDKRGKNTAPNKSNNFSGSMIGSSSSNWRVNTPGGLLQNDHTNFHSNLTLRPKIPSQQEQDSQPEPFTYKYFAEFPPEIRAKIWAEAAIHYGRIFEIERGIDPCVLVVRNGYFGPPAIMLVNREARKAVLLAHKFQIIDQFCLRTPTYSPEEFDPTGKFWFSPTLDTLYFGENSTLRSIVCTMSQVPAGIIERIAVNCSPNLIGENDYSQWDDWADYMCMVTLGGLSILKALHGIEGDRRFPGCKGIKEIMFVVRTSYKPIQPGSVDEHVTFRPPAIKGKTKAQLKYHREREDEIALVKSGGILPDVGVNRWLGKDMPNISFQTLTPRGQDRNVHRCLSVRGKRIDKLASLDGAILFKLQRLYNCTLEVANGFPDFTQETSEHQIKEVGFFGQAEDFPKVKKAIEKFLRVPLWKMTKSMVKVERIMANLDHLEQKTGCLIVLPPKESPRQKSMEFGLSGRPQDCRKAKDEIYRLG